MESDIETIIDTYMLFVKFEISVPQEEYDQAHSLRMNFDQMIKHSKELSLAIFDMQGDLLAELHSGITQYKTELDIFNDDFDINGPMEPGITAKEASDRVNYTITDVKVLQVLIYVLQVFLFQSRFDELWRKFEMYERGEKLFGLKVTEYPIMHQRKKEFILLNKLYSLYLQVLKKVDGYLEMPWHSFNINEINTELVDFQMRCRKLPKGMQAWPAYIDLKTKIDNFNEMCPLLEVMKTNSMKNRHWQQLETLMNYPFDVENAATNLGKIIEAPLLKYKDDVMVGIDFRIFLIIFHDCWNKYTTFILFPGHLPRC